MRIVNKCFPRYKGRHDSYKKSSDIDCIISSTTQSGASLQLALSLMLFTCRCVCKTNPTNRDPLKSPPTVFYLLENLAIFSQQITVAVCEMVTHCGHILHHNIHPLILGNKQWWLSEAKIVCLVGIVTPASMTMPSHSHILNMLWT